MPELSSPLPRGAFSTAVDLSTEEGRAFVQERLAFFCRIGFTLSGGALAVAILSRALAGEDVLPWPPRPGTSLALGTALVFLAGWLGCRRGRLPPAALGPIDAAVALLVCTMPSLILLVVDEGARHETSPSLYYTMLLVVTNVLVARSLYIPSPPRRTLGIGLVAVFPSLAAAASHQRFASGSALGIRLFAVESGIWFAAAVATSTVASSLIFGLRLKVREARQLGQYTLEEKLGEGGMGVVYRARHAMLRRPTAVKLLPREKAGENSIRRFEREVQLTAQLSHPNTVSIYDYGRTPDGVFYYAMEYLDGVNLELLVREFGPQPPARVVHVMRQVAGALAEAHGIGLIHRDVKPANIILGRRGGLPDVAKVVDFGLVKDLGGAADASVTAFHTIAGTPLYLSPESIARPERVDARSDLYALGAVGYYLLAGKNVFGGGTLVEVCSHHLHTKPEAPSAKLGRPLPAGVESVVLSCLEKDPARRPQGALQLAERLEACDPGGWMGPEAERWWARNGERLKALRTGTPRGAADATGLPTLSVDLEGRLASGDGGRLPS